MIVCGLPTQRNRAKDHAMPPYVPDRLLNPNETAHRLGFTRRHLEHMITAGTAPPSVKLGRLRRFPESKLSQWISELPTADNPRTAM
jgi:excisionase family DNA binding protein